MTSQFAKHVYLDQCKCHKDAIERIIFQRNLFYWKYSQILVKEKNVVKIPTFWIWKRLFILFHIIFPMLE